MFEKRQVPDVPAPQQQTKGLFGGTPTQARPGLFGDVAHAAMGPLTEQLGPGKGALAQFGAEIATGLGGNVFGGGGNLSQMLFGRPQPGSAILGHAGVGVGSTLLTNRMFKGSDSPFKPAGQAISNYLITKTLDPVAQALFRTIGVDKFLSSISPLFGTVAQPAANLGTQIVSNLLDPRQLATLGSGVGITLLANAIAKKNPEYAEAINYNAQMLSTIISTILTANPATFVIGALWTVISGIWNQFKAKAKYTKHRREARRAYTEEVTEMEPYAQQILDEIMKTGTTRKATVSRYGGDINDPLTMQMVFGLNPQGLAPAEEFAVGMEEKPWYMGGSPARRFYSALRLGDTDVRDLLYKGRLANPLQNISKYSDIITENLGNMGDVYGLMPEEVKEGVERYWGKSGGRGNWWDMYSTGREDLLSTLAGAYHYGMMEGTPEDVMRREWERHQYPLGFDPEARRQYGELMKDPYAKTVLAHAKRGEAEALEEANAPFKERMEKYMKTRELRPGSPLGMGGLLQTRGSIAALEKEVTRAGEPSRVPQSIYEEFLSSTEGLRNTPWRLGYNQGFRNRITNMLLARKAEQEAEYQRDPGTQRIRDVLAQEAARLQAARESGGMF